MRGGRWLCGAGLFLLLMGFFAITGVFGSSPDYPIVGNRSAALFFSVVLAYIVPVFHFISARTAAVITQLGADLPDPTTLARLHARVHHKPRNWYGAVIAIGLGAAIAHNAALAADEAIHADVLIVWLAMVIGTTLVWVVLTIVIAALIDNALLLNRLAHQVRINPLAVERLQPFAAVAVLSTLSIVGLQAAFPIMILDEAINAVAFVPGLIATIIPIAVLALLPIWPLHTRLRATKAQLLDEINARIATQPLPTPDESRPISELLPLLAWRREIQGLPEWPFDVGTVGRLIFYLIIPPLTWVGAALIERLVESTL